MRELELDGIHDDGEHVLLVDSDGERYALRIDKALRAAVRSDRPALNMIQAAGAAPLRPREIQAMLRSGRSAEDIAESSQIPLEHVRRYEGPVLAEREWAAQRARTFPVGRGGPALLEIVPERLAAREATGESAWDAWRRQDGTWTLELTFSAGGRTRQAHWVADLDNRSVSPMDDEARWISDEDAPPEPARARARLQAVKSAVYDLEADGSLEGIPTTTPRAHPWAPRRAGSDQHPSVIDDEDLEALNARRGLRSVPRPEDSATVWSGLDESEAAPPADEQEDAGPGSPADPAEDQRDAREGILAAAPDADREAALEHSTGADDPVDAAADPEAADLDGAELDGAELDGGDLDGAGLEAAEDDAAREGRDPGTGDRAEGDVTAPRPAAAAGPEQELRYQDTVDLTPLPGFDEARASSEPDAAAEDRPVRKARPRSKRASMPSWDEIVFGSKHD